MAGHDELKPRKEPVKDGLDPDDIARLDAQEYREPGRSLRNTRPTEGSAVGGGGGGRGDVETRHETSVRRSDPDRPKHKLVGSKAGDLVEGRGG